MRFILRPDYDRSKLRNKNESFDQTREDSLNEHFFDTNFIDEQSHKPHIHNH